MNSNKKTFETLKDGSVLYYKNKTCHRDDDMPAAIFSFGSMYWYKDGFRVRNYFSDYIDILTGKERYE